MRARQFHGIGGNGDLIVNGGSEGLARQVDQFDQVVEVAVVDLAGEAVSLDANGSGPSNDLAHHATGFHYPDGSESLVGDADATTCHEKVFNVTRIKAPIGNGVPVRSIDSFSVDGVGNERIVGKLFRVLLFGVVQVNAPSAGYTPIGEVSFGDNVLFRKNHVSEEAAGFPRPADVGDPGKFRILVIPCPIAILHRIEGAEDCP